MNDLQPLETRLISETSGVYPPDQVAKIVVKDAVVSGNGLQWLIRCHRAVTMSDFLFTRIHNNDMTTKHIEIKYNRIDQNK